MKKIIPVLAIFLLISCGTSTRKDRKKFTITDFSNIRVDTLIPYENKSYFAYIIKIKGEVDDTVKIKREGYYDVILSGTIDTLLNGDYYGTETVIWTFDPYRATKGKLEIEYSL